MKHKFTITYETDGLPICPDAIHEQLDQALRDIKHEFGKKYYMLPGLHKIYLEPCGDWFPEEQKPMYFKASSCGPQAASYKQQAASNGRLKEDTIKWYKEIERKIC